MRLLHFTLLLLLIVPFTSCQTSYLDSVKSPRTVPDSDYLEEKNEPNIAVDGDWLILYHCDGIDYLFHTISRATPDSFQLFLSGNPEPMKMAFNRKAQSRPQSVPPELSGEYDDKSNSFIVSGRLGANETIMRGVFESSERFAAKMEGRNWKNCSLIIGVRKKHRDDLEKLRAKADSKLPGILKKSQLGALFRQFSFRKRNPKCGNDEIQWMKKINTLEDDVQGHTSKHSTPALVLFEDDNFEPFFDKPLRRIGLKQGVGIAHMLQRTSGCGQISRDSFKQQVFNDVVQILQNSPPLTRNFVMTNNAAGMVINKWLNANTLRLGAMVNAYSETPEMGLKHINALEKTTEYMNALVWSVDNPDYHNQLTASKASFEKKILLNSFARLYEATGNTFNELNQLSGFSSMNARQYQLLSDVEKERVQNQIQTRVNEGAMDAARAYVMQNKSEESYAKVGNWRTRFLAFSNLLTMENQRSINGLIDGHREDTASHLLADFRKQFNQKYPTVLEALSAKVAFEKRMQNVSPELLNRPEFIQFSNDRAGLRRSELSNASVQIQKKMAASSNETELAGIRLIYLLRDDEQTAAGKSILDTLETRVKIIAPFSGYPGAVYLNALYGNDWQTIREEDRAFAIPLARMMQPMHNSGIYDFMALFSGGNVKGQDLKQYMHKKIKSASMSTSMAGFFVIALEHIAPQCLGPKPVKIKRTETWDQVFYNGYGMELYRVSNTQTRHYTIAHRHHRAFQQLGQPASAEGLDFINGLLGKFGMKKDGVRLSMDKLSANLRGLKMAMENYPCDGEIMKRLESALVKLALER